MVALLFVHCYSPFSIFFTVELNPMLGSHTGELTCSLQTAIHDQLLTTPSIVEISFQG